MHHFWNGLEKDATNQAITKETYVSLVKIVYHLFLCTPSFEEAQIFAMVCKKLYTHYKKTTKNSKIGKLIVNNPF